jgi:hypothetical protein
MPSGMARQDAPTLHDNAPVPAARGSGRSLAIPGESTVAHGRGRGAGLPDVTATPSTPDTPKMDQPGESRRPPSQNAPAEQLARKAALPDPADLQLARATPGPVVTHAGAAPSHGAASPASGVSAAQRTATGPGWPRSSDAGSAASSPRPTQPQPTSHVAEPRRAAVPGQTPPAATTPQPHSQASADARHPKRG